MWADYIRQQREKISHGNNLYSQLDFAKDLTQKLKRRVTKVFISRLERHEIEDSKIEYDFLLATIEVFREHEVEIGKTIDEVAKRLKTLSVIVPHGLMSAPILLSALNDNGFNLLKLASFLNKDSLPVFIQPGSRIKGPTYGIPVASMFDELKESKNERQFALTAAEIITIANEKKELEPDLIVLPGDLPIPKNYVRIGQIISSIKTQCSLLVVTDAKDLIDNQNEKHIFQALAKNSEKIGTITLLRVKNTISEIQADMYIHQALDQGLNLINIDVSIADFEVFKNEILNPIFKSNKGTFLFLCWPPFTNWVQQLAIDNNFCANIYELYDIVDSAEYISTDQKLKYFSLDILGNMSLFNDEKENSLYKYIKFLDGLIDEINTKKSFWNAKEIFRLAEYLNMTRDSVIDYASKIDFHLLLYPDLTIAQIK